MAGRIVAAERLPAIARRPQEKITARTESASTIGGGSPRARATTPMLCIGGPGVRIVRLREASFVQPRDRR